MEEMLLTWRIGHDGKELFGVTQQISIERGVWGGAPSHPDVRFRRFHNHGVSNSLLIHCCFRAPQPSTGFYSGQGQISKGQVLRELEFTLGQKERAIQANPYDSALQQQVNILRQLRKMVETGVSSDEHSLNFVHSVRAVPLHLQRMLRLTHQWPPQDLLSTHTLPIHLYHMHYNHPRWSSLILRPCCRRHKALWHRLQLLLLLGISPISTTLS